MATGTIKTPVKITLTDLSNVNIFYNPNYGEILGFEMFTGGHQFDIYFNKDDRTINFYKDKTLIWSK